jgi:hypothetical protein
MTAPIIPNVGTTTTTTTTNSPTTSKTTSTTSVDNQSAYSADITAGNDLTIIRFSSIMLSATDQAAETSWQVQQYNATSRKDMYNASILQALDLAQIYSIFLKLATQYVKAAHSNKSLVISINNNISNYNNGITNDQIQINTLNAAIAGYNAGTVTAAQLQTAINTYNAYAANRNASINNLNNQINAFNAAVTLSNAIIIQINQQLTAQGVPPQKLLKLQDKISTIAAFLPIATAPASPPMNSISFTSTFISPVANTMTPVKDTDTGVELASAMFQPLFDLMAGQFAITAAMLQNQSAFQGFVQFFLTNKLPFIPDAFYNPQNPVSSSGNDTGGSASSTALTTSLNSNFLEAILSQNQFLASVTRAEFDVNFSQVKRELQYLQSALLSQLGLQSGSTALRLLGDRLPFIDLRASPVASALGITLASEIGLAVNNGDINSPVKDILARAFPDIDAQSLNSLAKQLSATLGLSLSLTGLFQLGLALKNPQLLAQLISNIPNAAALGTNSAIPSSILKDQQIAQLLQNALSTYLVSSANISLYAAQNDVKNALTAATNATSDAVAQTYADSLTQQGIEQQQAIASADLLQSIIRSETLARNILNQKVQSDSLSHSLLANQLISDIISQNPNLTYRQLRDNLAKEFEKNGASPPQAINVATLAITGNPLANAPISTNSTSTSLSISANLQTAAASLAVNLGLNPAQTDQLTTLLQTTVTNLQSQINENLNTLAKINNDKVTEKAKENFQTFLAPTLDLYVFAEKLRDPANTLVYCVQAGIMYAHPQSTNNTPGIEFYV